MIHDGSGWSDDSSRMEGYYVAGNRIIGARQTAIATPSGGSTTDAEARGAVAGILAALRAHGLIAP
jgi:hypothetical protein